MRQWSIHPGLRKPARAEKYAWAQAACLNAARKIQNAKIASPPGYLKRVTGQVPIGAKEAAGTLPEIGNDHNFCLIISCAGFDPCLPLAHLIRRSQVCISVTAPYLQPTELVEQKEVNHTTDGVGPIHSRGAILQNVD